MAAISRWTLLLLLASLSMGFAKNSKNKNNNNNNKNNNNHNNNHQNNNNNNNNNNHPSATATDAPTPSPFVATMDNFVESDAATDTEGMHPPLKVSFWTTPHRDWDSRLLLRMQPLVVRLQKHVIAFHPHQGIIDGSLIGCHNPNGPTDLTKLDEACLDNCINAGRYCAVFYPEMVGIDTTHKGLIGADLVTESARRLCIWIAHGQKPDEIHKYFDYVEAIRQTNCDLSLSDNCIDRVYRQVGIDSKQVADCLHQSGGVGSQVDMNNAILQGEMHRSNSINLTYEELPHVALNGEELVNVTQYSDWQIMAEICTALQPKPKLCDFCLWECPIGNDYHDPTQQCLWDLTCGDDRTFDDWFHGTGPFANSTTNDSNEEQEAQVAITEEPSMPPTVPPTIAENDDDDALKDDDDLEDLDDLWMNSTNAAASDDDITTSGNNDTNATVPSHKPAHPNHNNNNNNHNNKPTSSHNHKTTPEPTPAPHQQHSKPTYNSPIAPPKPTKHSNHHAPTVHNSGAGTAGGNSHHNAHTPPKKKSPNTTSASSAVEGLAIAVVCLGAVIMGVYYIQRYRSGKDVYATVENRDAAGLASTASHSSEQDLELHVEMAAPPAAPAAAKRLGAGNGVRSDGYAPPGKGSWA